MNITSSPVAAASERYIASPLPRTGPSSGSSSACRRTSAPARRATSAVPSSESASITSTWSTSSPRREDPLHDRADGVGHLARGQHHRQRGPLALEQQLQRELGVFEGADHAARTMANRCPSPANRCPGSRFSTAARARSWWPGRRSAPRTRSPSRSPRASIPSCARRSIAPASARSTPIRPTRSPPRTRATRSSRPAPPAASRWRSTCRCSTRSAATARRARSTSTPPRRSPRTRRGRCTR